MVAGKVLKNTPARPALQFARWWIALASVPWISFPFPGMHHKLWHCSVGVCSQTWQVLHEVRQAWQEMQGTSFFSQEEKMGLCDGWHATKGMCFLGGFGEEGLSKLCHASSILGM